MDTGTGTSKDEAVSQHGEEDLEAVSQHGEEELEAVSQQGEDFEAISQQGEQDFEAVSQRASHFGAVSRHGTDSMSELIQQKMKAELARKRLEFLEKEIAVNQEKAKMEADLLVRKASIKAKLKRIKAEEDTVVADLNVRFLEEELSIGVSDDGDECYDKPLSQNQPPPAMAGSTREVCLSPVNLPQRPLNVSLVNLSNRPLNVSQVNLSNRPLNVSQMNLSHRPLNVSQVNLSHRPPNNQDKHRSHLCGSELNPTARHFEPTITSNPGYETDITRKREAPTDLNQAFVDMTNFMTKKSFIMERVKTFSGESEHYLGWKSTFKEVVTEIDASPSIELDLMLHNLRGQPHEQVRSIKNSNASNSVLALQVAWERLDSYYGSPDRIAKALKTKLHNIISSFNAKNKMSFYQLSDTLNEINAVKNDPKYGATLSYFDTAEGVNQVVQKFPQNLQNKWRDKAVNYKQFNNVVYPPFGFFCSFIQNMACIVNDPGFDFDSVPYRSRSYQQDTSDKQIPRFIRQNRQNVTVNKTVVAGDSRKPRCVLHNSDHLTSECRVFRNKTLSERRDFLRKHGQCFKCCDGKHLVTDCRVSVKCDSCGNKSHCTAMHSDQRRTGIQDYNSEKSHVDNNQTSMKTVDKSESISQVSNACTEVCGKFSSRSCGKIVLVTIHHERSQLQPKTVYAVLDDQANKSLAKKELFDLFDPDSSYEKYNLKTCSGTSMEIGRRSHGFIIESLDKKTKLKLPTLVECDRIPGNRNEIPTKDVAVQHPHMADIADMVPPIDNMADISLLIGRDLPGAHHVLDQRIGEDSNQPFAQLLPLGWVVVGETCLDGMHIPTPVSVMKTVLLPSIEQPTTGVFVPCDKRINVTEHFDSQSIFQRTNIDNKPAMSIDDRSFIALMDRDMKKDSTGHWVAPLPFKESRPALQNNRKQALDRAISLDNSLRKNPSKLAHFLEFMSGILDASHAELAEPLPPHSECWYLPLFGVYHPQKKDRIRGVFDSSAKCDGVSLNDVLISGPDLMNNLVGVLLRFRREPIAIMADIEKMFYCFFVEKDHRRFLRFIWHKDNDFQQPLVDYQMKVHVFGNSPSPAVATFGLRRTADKAEAEYGSDMKAFVHRNFYVDDALSSHSSAEEAVDLLQRTKDGLQKYGRLRLHKISSNSSTVLAAFDKDDLSKDLKDVELWIDTLPMQRSLGVCWNLEGDYFTFKVNIDEKPFTRRGVLSSINSLFDPLGFVAPVTITGKSILREAMTGKFDWDEPLAQDFLKKWNAWKSTLKDLESLRIPRTFAESSLSQAGKKDLLVFSDASEAAIAAVAYIRITALSGEQQLGFVLGKTKLAPKHGHTVPRLELCAAVLATELYDIIVTEIDSNFDSVRFYTDSKVVIGYIQNESKRYFTYVANRVDKIRRSCKPSDWNYIPTKLNPADGGTRSIAVKDIQKSLWLNGPPEVLDSVDEGLPADVNDSVCPEILCLKTEAQSAASVKLGCHRFERFSDWHRLTRAVSLIQRVFLGVFLHRIRVSDNVKTDTCTDNPQAYTLRQAELLILRVVQNETFHKEIEALQNGNPVARSSSIYDLDPYIDGDGILRVGGRLRRSQLSLAERNPILVPKRSHIAELLIAHYHREVMHQGRLFTEGAIRSAGYWIVGCRCHVNTYLHNCVTCRKLRGKQLQPKMADLTAAQLQPAPPFTYVGVDVFGPWTIVTRQTRGGQAKAKRWAVLFTCLVIRAVHIEVIEDMSTSSFINALRRFTALRGEVRLMCSDCGTNFVGATSELKIDVIDISDSNLQRFMEKQRIQWKFNPPHASHMGGAWERLIGVSRKILDSLLLDPKVTCLTHEVLSTLMAEVCSIINARPITDIPSDPQSPAILTPATLLTMKTTHTVDMFNIEEFCRKDLYKNQWRCVQYLSKCFWKGWKGEYLSSLQSRRKWQQGVRNLKDGDIVLLCDKTVHRNDWPMGVIEKVLTSDDSCVRKVEIRVGADRKLLVRPVTEIILLIEKELQFD